MAGYKPKYISGMQSGLIQSREEFLLPHDAYPQLINAYVWRERIKRKQGFQLIGRLTRTFTSVNIGINNISTGVFFLFYSFITGITQGANAVVTTSFPHGMITGTSFVISGVIGSSGINNMSSVATVITPTTFSTGLTTTTAYISGGIVAPALPIFSSEPMAIVVPGSVTIVVAGLTLYDQGDGTLATNPPSSTVGTINYFNGTFAFNTVIPNSYYYVTFSYYPNLPVMGIRTKEQQSSLVDETVFFDTKYAYKYNGTTFQEYLPGTIWTGQDFEFFWTTNYWVDQSNFKIFWATNYSTSGDPIRFTNGIPGTFWVNFTPTLDSSGTLLFQCLALLPFRGRLVAFNTSEGPAASGPGLRYTNRIRWAAIGTPFDTNNLQFNVGVNQTAWRDDIRGQGGFLDIPTSEDIVSVGFVRDNLVIYCENSTWQLRYTGRSIAPFQIEKVNSEIGSSGTFSSIQFDTSLLCIGPRGIVECDSFQSTLIDIKIPDFVFREMTNDQNGQSRVQGIRDFVNRLAYWTYNSSNNKGGIYPNSRLVYNYENDSWAIFTDSLTALGLFQLTKGVGWLNTNIPWVECNFPWIFEDSQEPVIVGGTQQGFIEQLDIKTTNDPSLYISNIVGNVITSTALTSPSHNLSTNDVIMISGIPPGTGFSNLNGQIFGINVPDPNTILLNIYSAASDQFNIPEVDGLGIIVNITNAVNAIMIVSGTTSGLTTGQQIQISGVLGMTQVNGNIYTITILGGKSIYLNVNSTGYSSYISGGTFFTPYTGGGVISVRDNFKIKSKKFNFIDEGQNIQLGYLDILMNATGGKNPGAISLNIYLDYDDGEATNTFPENENEDTFFNSVIPTTASTLNGKGGSKFWQRVICPTRGSFITLEYTFSNAQLIGIEQQSDVQIDAQVLWIRPAGRLTQI